MSRVKFTFHTGCRHRLFTSVSLCGSWDEDGTHSADWSTQPMQEVTSADGARSWEATVELEAGQEGWTFEWGVKVDGDAGQGIWAIASEVQDAERRDRVRRFVLREDGQQEAYYLTQLSRLGANVLTGGSPPRVRFAVWAPNARAVSLVIGDPDVGYIGDAGEGVVARCLMLAVGGGVWETTVTLPSALDTVYMFEITDDAGQMRYRTDLYSRCQVGSGCFDPLGVAYSEDPLDLDGRVSLSHVVDPALVEDPIGSDQLVGEAEFWADEFEPSRPVPRRIEELVIYELHVGALAHGEDRPGNIDDAIALLPYLEELGVNAVELLPLAEFSGSAGWGYGATHFAAIEFSSGGPDHLKAFVRACHQRGIAVILDVVYNHYPPEADRAEWMFDTTSHEKNPYYWYEGCESDHEFPEGGYIDNQSSGWAPAYHAEMVRGLFVSSAVALLLDFHLDGFRVDQTTSIHSYAALHADGRAADQAKIFGAKFLREWARTLRLVKPNVILIAEDHSGWGEVTAPIDKGGMGFDAVWFNDFYHHLIGDTGRSPNLLASAGYGGEWSLGMGHFAGLLQRTAPDKIVFHESHDECGNSENGGVRSGRTLLVAVHAGDPAEVEGERRGYAEARSRVVAALSLLSGGVPMFFMGEEIGAKKPYKHDDWLGQREDLWGEKQGAGARLFAFYRDLIGLRRRVPALRASNLEVVHAHDDNRVLCFKRWGEHSEVLVLASLANRPYGAGYLVSHPHLPNAAWREVLNSDAACYGGLNYGSCGGTLVSSGGVLEAVVPANGVVVFERV